MQLSAKDMELRDTNTRWAEELRQLSNRLSQAVTKEFGKLTTHLTPRIIQQTTLDCLLDKALKYAILLCMRHHDIMICLLKLMVIILTMLLCVNSELQNMTHVAQQQPILTITYNS
jgi:hypothetical protein